MGLETLKKTFNKLKKLKKREGKPLKLSKDEREYQKIARDKDTIAKLRKFANPTKRLASLKRLGFGLKRLRGLPLDKQKQIIATFLDAKQVELSGHEKVLGNRIKMTQSWKDVQEGRLKPRRGKRPSVPEAIRQGYARVYNPDPPNVDAASREALTNMLSVVKDVVAGDVSGQFLIMPSFRLTANNIASVINDQRSRKTSPGFSGITYGDLSRMIEMEPALPQSLADVGNEVLDKSKDLQDPIWGDFENRLEGLMPDFFRQVKVVMLPKVNPPNLTDPKRWRPIALIETTLKVLLEVIRRAIVAHFTAPIRALPEDDPAMNV